MNDLSANAQRLLRHLVRRSRRLEQLPTGEIHGSMERVRVGDLRQQLGLTMPELRDAMEELDRSGRLTVSKEPIES